MADASDSGSRGKGQGLSGWRRDVALFSLALLVVLGLMVASVYYPYPDGKPIGVWNLVMFWLREILLIAFLLFVLAAILWACLRHIANPTGGHRSAP
jgi:glycerol-3-phosphate acyltransferase PlsY